MPDPRNIENQINQPLIGRDLNVQGDTVIYFGDVFYAKDPDREYLTIQPPRVRSYLNRDGLLSEIKSTFDSGTKLFVLHGESGRGKSTVAKLFFHQYDEAYEQKAFIPYTTDIRKSIVASLNSHHTEKKGRKTQELYEATAGSECVYLQNSKKKRLIIIDGVADWEDLVSFISFLQLKDTDYLITAELASSVTTWEDYSLKVRDHELPSLSEEDVKTVLEEFHEQESRKALEIKGADGNLFLLNLIAKQAPKGNPLVVRRYLKSVVLRESDPLAITMLVLQEADLTSAEFWVLLQLAALPLRTFDAKDLGAFLFEDVNEANNLDLNGLKGYQLFANDNPGLHVEEGRTLAQSIDRLLAKGWLCQEEEGEFSLHALLRKGLDNLFKNRDYKLSSDAFCELAESLNNAFFTELSDLLLDDLEYENHLRAFVDFVPAQQVDSFLSVLKKLFNCEMSNGKFTAGLALGQQYLQLFEAYAGRTNEGLLAHRVKLMGCLRLCGYYDRALIFGEATLRLTERLGRHVDWSIEIELGQIYQKLGRFDDAAAILLPALEAIGRTYGLASSMASTVKSILALVYLDLGQLDQALKLLASAYAAEQKNRGPEDLKTMAIGGKLALVYKNLGRYAEAIAILEKAEKVYLANLGPRHLTTLQIQTTLGLAYSRMGLLQPAKELLQQVHQVSIETLGKEHPNTAIAQSNYALALESLGNYEEAADLQQAVLKIETRSLGPMHPGTLTTCFNLGAALNKLKRFEEALDVLEANLPLAEEVFGETSSNFIRFRMEYVRALFGLSRLDEALTIAMKNLYQSLLMFGPHHELTARNQFDLASYKLAKGDKLAAVQLWKQSLATWERIYGPNHPESKAMRDQIASL